MVVPGKPVVWIHPGSASPREGVWGRLDPSRRPLSLGPRRPQAPRDRHLRFASLAPEPVPVSIAALEAASDFSEQVERELRRSRLRLESINPGRNAA